MAVDIANDPPTTAVVSSLTPPGLIDATGLTTTVPLTIKNGKQLSGVEVWATGTAASGFVVDSSGGIAKVALGLAVSASDWVTGAAAGDGVLAGDPTKFMRVGGLAAAAPSVSIDLANNRIGVGAGAGATAPANRLVVDNGGIAFTGSEAFSGTNSGLYGSTSTLKVQCAGVDRLTIASSDFTWRLPTTTLLAIGSGNSLTAVALQINGDPNTGLAQIAGADSLSLVAGGVERIQVYTDVVLDAAGTIALKIAGANKLSLQTGTLTFSDSVNIAFNTGTGTKIGTATTQKLAFHNSAPIAQETVTGSRLASPALADLLTKLANKGLIVDGTTI